MTTHQLLYSLLALSFGMGLFIGVALTLLNRTLTPPNSTKLISRIVDAAMGLSGEPTNHTPYVPSLYIESTIEMDERKWN